MTFVLAIGWLTWGLTHEAHLKYNIEMYNNEHIFIYHIIIIAELLV